MKRSMTDSRASDLHQALSTLRRHVPEVSELLKTETDAERSTWTAIIDRSCFPAPPRIFR